MPCSSCNRGLTTISRIPISLLDCNYTKDMMIGWKDKLLCVRDKDLLKEVGLTNNMLNSFLGIVLSGLSFEYNICYLNDKLQNIEPYISNIESLGEC